MLVYFRYIFLLVVWLLVVCTVWGVTDPGRDILVVAGNFSIDGKMLNIAQYDMSTGKWSAKRQEALYVYGENNGVVWDVVVNRTTKPFNSIFAVGAFDTETKTSQLQFCSVSQFDGASFSKVGEGLCPRGEDSSTMNIYTIILGNNGDLFVGGTFESRVWDGHHFVNVFNVAHFDARESSWLPLTEGELKCNNGNVARVNTMAWDETMSILYIGGSFHAVDNVTISSGLAMWSRRTGLISFPGGGVSNGDGGAGNTQVKSIAYEPKSESLFIAGLFRSVGDHSECTGVAVWNRWSNLWRCLQDETHGISVATAMLLTPTHLYLSGWASASSSWRLQYPNSANPYAIARLNIVGYISENNAFDSAEWVYNAQHTRSAENSIRDGITTDASRRNDSIIGDHNNMGKGSEPRKMRNRRQLSSSKRSKYNTTHTSTMNGTHSEYSIQTYTHSVFSRPEDHPCITEDYQQVCQVRPAGHILVHNDHNSIHSATLKSEHNSRRRRLRSSSPLAINNNNINNKNGKESIPIYTAGNTGTFNPRLWSVQWEWLPQFEGTNGPVFSLTEGRDHLKGNILIAGAFYNYPALVVYSVGGMSSSVNSGGSKVGNNKGRTNKYIDYPTRNSSDHVYTTNGNSNSNGNTLVGNIPGSYALTGLITSVVQAYLPMETEDSPIPVPPPHHVIPTYDTFFVVFGCVGVGIALGLIFALGCCTKGFHLPYYNYFFRIGNNNYGSNEDSPNRGMSLLMLSGGEHTANALQEFRLCFERAMSARHLPTHETLLIINPKEIVLSKIIGEGSFGRVWSGHWRNNGVAVKEFVFAQAAIEGGSLQRNSIIEEIVGEAGIMACLRHPKILQLYGCSLTMQAIWIVSELCGRGSLRMLLNNKTIDLPLTTKLSICMDIADGMHYLHSRAPPVIHRDLKSLNIFILETAPGVLVAKIGDWGSARAVALTGAKSMTQGVGTACWLSPEVICHAHFSKHSDVYAFGIILWEVFTRQDVYVGLSAAQIISKVAHEGLRPKVPPDCDWERIMTSCWKENPRERPTFHTVLVALSTIYTAARIRHNAQMSDGIAPPNTAGALSSGLLLSATSKSSTSLAETSPDEPLLSEYAGLRQAPDLVVDATNEATSWLSATYQNNDHLTKKANNNPRHMRHPATNPPVVPPSPQSRPHTARQPSPGPTTAPPLRPQNAHNSSPSTHSNNPIHSDNHHHATPHVDNDQRALPHLSSLMIDTAAVAPPSIHSSPAQPTPRMFLPPSSAGISTHTHMATEKSVNNMGQSTEPAPPQPVVSVLKSSLHRGSLPRSASNSNTSSSAQVSPDRTQAQAQAQAKAHNIYRNDASLTFELGELTGPTYYIQDDASDAEDGEADPLDFLFARERKNNASAPQPEKYLGDKALKPHSVRRVSGSKLAGKFK